jgi:hypothetical protein
MRYTSSRESPIGTKRMMLVEKPQDPLYHDGILCSMYDGADDRPPVAVHFFEGFTAAQVIAELEETSGRAASSWSSIPDQVVGCQDDWLGPVRAIRDEHGKAVRGQWERLEDGQWVRFEM